MVISFVLSAVSIFLTVLNLLYSFQNKNAKWFIFGALAFTALTVCSFFADQTSLLMKDDLTALLDVMPTMSKMLWGCVGISILLNAISLFKNESSKNK